MACWGPSSARTTGHESNVLASKPPMSVKTSTNSITTVKVCVSPPSNSVQQLKLHSKADKISLIGPHYLPKNLGQPLRWLCEAQSWFQRATNRANKWTHELMNSCDDWFNPIQFLCAHNIKQINQEKSRNFLLKSLISNKISSTSA